MQARGDFSGGRSVGRAVGAWTHRTSGSYGGGVRPLWMLPAAVLLGACASTAALTDTPSARTARYLASIQGESAQEAAFLREMPKGGDLHNHLSGSVYAESYLRWAVEDGFCVRRSPAAVLEPPCDPAAGSLPAADVLPRDTALYNALVDGLSLRNFVAGPRSGHEQFFSTFAGFNTRRERSGDMLAEVVSRLARQNTWYLESMQSLGVGSAGRLGVAAGWSDDLAAMRARLPEASLDALVVAARGRLDAEESRMLEVLRCGQPNEDPGCRVVVRYVVQVIRTLPREEVFAQIAAAVKVVQGDPRVVALNLVAPEDDPVARRDYDVHMRAVAHLTERGTRVPVTLHAGELTPVLVPPEDAGFHIADAVRVAGARRIGHGTDIAWERDALAHPAFPRAGRVLLGGAGGGRELVALTAMGYTVDAFEPAATLFGALAAHPTAGLTLRASYADLMRAASHGEGPLAPLRGRGYEGVVLGWASFTHLTTDGEAESTLRAVRVIAPQTTALVSYLGPDDDGRANGRVEALRPRVRAGLARLTGRAEPLAGEGFAPGAGFYRRFAPTEFEDLARAAGYDVATHAAEPYPHALLTPRGR